MLRPAAFVFLLRLNRQGAQSRQVRRNILAINFFTLSRSRLVEGRVLFLFLRNLAAFGLSGLVPADKKSLDAATTPVVDLPSSVVGFFLGGAAMAIKLTKLELEIMEAVWALGSGSVREIQEQLPERKRPAYTTVQTIIYRLEEKGAVRRVKKIGNAHIFEPLVTRKAAHNRLIDDLLHVFGGSPRMLMAQLVETGQLTLEDIRSLETAIAKLAAGESAPQRTAPRQTTQRRRRKQ